jgi:uncharacterized membrane protein
MLDLYIKFIRAHETILVLVLAAVVIFGVANRIQAIEANHDDTNLKTAQAVSTAQAQKDAVFAAQVAEDKATFTALQTKIDAQNAALIQANATLAAALTKQQKVDASLPLPELANRWTALVPSAKPQATPTGVTLDSVGATATVEQLEQVPVLTTELAHEQTLVTNGNALAIAQTKQVTDLNSQVSGLQLKAVDDAKTCQEQIKVVKDEARKREKWIGIIGAVLGYALRGKV